jgi:hypothetical protein
MKMEIKTSVLIKDTTKEQRKKIVEDGLALTTLDAPRPSDDVLKLYDEYIEGRIELAEVEKIVLERYKRIYHA